MALNRRLQVVAPEAMLDEFDTWTATVEAVSIADLLRRAIYLLGRMVELGIDPHREAEQTRRGSRFGIFLSDTSMDRLKATSQALGMSMSQTCCLAFLWYREVAQSQFEAKPFPLRSKAGVEVDCTRLLLP